MQYPELNIREFSRKHSANVDLEKEDDSYVLNIYVEPEDQEAYPVNIEARPRTIEQIADLYEEHFVDFARDKLLTVYGNDENAIQSMLETDSWARFENPGAEATKYREILSKSASEARNEIYGLETVDYQRLLNMEEQGENRTGLKVYLQRQLEEQEPVQKSRGWAVNLEPLIRGMADDPYEEIAEKISAHTLYAVNRAESRGEVSTGLLDFHKRIIRELSSEPEGPIEIEVEEETEPEQVHRIDYNQVLNDLDQVTIDQAKRLLEEADEQMGEEEWQEAIEAERLGKQRKTFLPYLKERLEEEKD